MKQTIELDSDNLANIILGNLQKKGLVEGTDEITLEWVISQIGFYNTKEGGPKLKVHICPK